MKHRARAALCGLLVWLHGAGWALAATEGLVQPPAAPVQVQVQVPSLDAPGGAAIQLPGFWFPAPGAAGSSPAPALVLLHGCGGPYEGQGQQRRLSLRMREHAQRWHALGVAALVVDSLTPRGETELCTQAYGQRQVTMVQRRRDALGALQWLAAQITGHTAQVESYAGAYHGFDGTAPLRLRRDVPNGTHPGQGVHVGGHAEARALALARLTGFLRERWALPAAASPAVAPPAKPQRALIKPPPDNAAPPAAAGGQSAPSR